MEPFLSRQANTDVNQLITNLKQQISVITAVTNKKV